MSPKLKVFIVLLVAILLAAIGEALAAKGMKEVDTKLPVLAQIRAGLGDWHVWVGIACMFGYVLLYVYTLALAELSVVLPLSAASYLIGIILSKYYLHEEIKPARWIGTLVIIAGVLITATTAFGSNSDE